MIDDSHNMGANHFFAHDKFSLSRPRPLESDHLRCCRDAWVDQRRVFTHSM